MEPGFRSLLYTEPHLYDLVFPDPDGSLVRMCRDAFRRYMPAAPASALDIGCGTGRYLGALAETVAECWGVDLLDTNVAYARATRPRAVCWRRRAWRAASPGRQCTTRPCPR